MKNTFMTSLFALSSLALSSAVIAEPSCGQSYSSSYVAPTYTAPKPVQQPHYSKPSYTPAPKYVPTYTVAPAQPSNNGTLVFLPPTDQKKQVPAPAQRPVLIKNPNTPDFASFRATTDSGIDLSAPHSPFVSSLNGVSIDSGR